MSMNWTAKITVEIYWLVSRTVEVVFLVLLYATMFVVRAGAGMLLRKRQPVRVLAGTMLANLLEALGPTFIKVGQILSSRPDLLSPELVRPLMRLQDDIAPFDVCCIPRLIHNAFGRPMNEIFASFDFHPICCASIAHVHRARLKDGRDVAVKIRRPGIIRTLDNDFRILHFCARLLSPLPGMSTVPLDEMLTEIGDAVKLQTNFAAEAENNRRFRKHFFGAEHIKLPNLVDELCVDSIMTMEFLDGLEKVSATRLTASERKRAALAGLRALYKMIFIDGFIHADMHPGNVFLRGEGEFVILDTGLVARLSDSDLRHFTDFFLGIVNNDGKACARVVQEMAIYYTKSYDQRAFEAAMVDLIAEYSALKSSEFEIARFVYQLMKTQREFGVCGSSKFMLTILSMVVFDGICKDIYPECDFQAEARPFLIIADYSRKPARSLQPRWWAPESIRARRSIDATSSA